MHNIKTLKQYANEAVQRILVNISRGVKHTDRLHGPSGIGKTAIIRQMVDRLAEETGEPWGFASINIANHGAWDLIGMPDVQADKTVFKQPEFLPDLSVPGTPANGIFLVDEIDKAKGDMVNACMPLIAEGKVGSYQIPEGWIIIAAQNRVIDNAGSAGTINSANIRRAVDIGIYADADELCQYATKEGWHPMVTAFLGFRPELVHEFPDGIQTKDLKGRYGFACPATWEMTSDFMEYGFETPVLRGYLADGILGEGVATEFTNFLQVVDNLPSFKEILRGGKPQVSSDQISVKFALISLLAQKTNGEIDFHYCVHYCHDELGPEFGATYVRLVTARCPDLKDSQTYRDYKINHQNLHID
tara:strand:- start:258 stop:1337 length:1080 start_codon:yes stop_codon:yes gene_type:complete